MWQYMYTSYFLFSSDVVEAEVLEKVDVLGDIVEFWATIAGTSWEFRRLLGQDKGDLWILGSRYNNWGCWLSGSIK